MSNLRIFRNCCQEKWTAIAIADQNRAHFSQGHPFDVRYRSDHAIDQQIIAP